MLYQSPCISQGLGNQQPGEVWPPPHRPDAKGEYGESLAQTGPSPSLYEFCTSSVPGRYGRHGRYGDSDFSSRKCRDRSQLCKHDLQTLPTLHSRVVCLTYKHDLQGHTSMTDLLVE